MWHHCFLHLCDLIICYIILLVYCITFVLRYFAGEGVLCKLKCVTFSHHTLNEGIYCSLQREKIIISSVWRGK